MTEFYAETSHASGPIHFAGKVTSSSPEIGGEVLRQKTLARLHSSVDRIEMCKRSCDGGVIKLVCRYFDQWQQWSGLSLEWICLSNFLCKVHKAHPCVALCGICDHSRLGASLIEMIRKQVLAWFSQIPRSYYNTVIELMHWVFTIIPVENIL